LYIFKPFPDFVTVITEFNLFKALFRIPKLFQTVGTPFFKVVAKAASGIDVLR
jgi:hypothetical protein